MFKRISLILCCVHALAMAGERVALLGDSMTWIGGERCENPRGWTHHYAQTHQDSLYVYARSGATWTHTAATRGSLTEVTGRLSDNNVIYSQTLRLLDDLRHHRLLPPHRILIYAGTNDAWFADQRPGIFAAEPQTSLAGAIALSCTLLRDSLPGTEITLMTPPLFPQAPADLIHQVSDTIETAGRRLDLKTLRADSHLHLDPATDTTDGVHTNPTGAKKIAQYIIENGIL